MDYELWIKCLGFRVKFLVNRCLSVKVTSWFKMVSSGFPLK